MSLTSRVSASEAFYQIRMGNVCDALRVLLRTTALSPGLTHSEGVGTRHRERGGRRGTLRQAPFGRLRARAAGRTRQGLRQARALEIGDSHLFLQRRRSGTYRNGKKWVTVPNFPKGNGTLTAGRSPAGRGENGDGWAGWGPKHPPFGPSGRHRERQRSRAALRQAPFGPSAGSGLSASSGRTRQGLRDARATGHCLGCLTHGISKRYCQAGKPDPRNNILDARATGEVRGIVGLESPTHGALFGMHEPRDRNRRLWGWSWQYS